MRRGGVYADRWRAYFGTVALQLHSGSIYHSGDEFLSDLRDQPGGLVRRRHHCKWPVRRHRVKWRYRYRKDRHPQ